MNNEEFKQALIEKVLGQYGDSEEIVEALRIDLYQLIDEEATRRLNSKTIEQLLELL